MSRRRTRRSNSRNYPTRTSEIIDLCNFMIKFLSLMSLIGFMGMLASFSGLVGSEAGEEQIENVQTIGD